MGYLLLAVIIIISVINQFINKKFSMRYGDNFPLLFSFGFLWTALAAIFYGMCLAISGEGFSIGFGEVLLSLMAGSGMVLSTFFINRSYREGPVALVLMFTTASTAIMCFLGVFLFKESMSIKQIIGICLLFVAVFVLIYGKKNKESEPITKNFLICAFLGMIFNTFIMIGQKGKPIFFKDTSVIKFCFFMFLWSAIINLIFMILYKIRKEQTKSITVFDFVLPSIGVGVCICSVNQLAILASTMLDAAVQFPIQAGSSLVIGTIVAAIFFKEKITVVKEISIAIAICSFVLIT